MNLATTCKNSWRQSAEIVDVHHRLAEHEKLASEKARAPLRQSERKDSCTTSSAAVRVPHIR